MFITGLGIASPPQSYAQKECWDVFRRSTLSQHLSPRSRAIVKKVLTGDNGIVTRHLVLGTLEEAFDLTPDALHARFARHAPLLATQAAERALANSGTRADQIDAVIISTCTGYLCPGLSSYVTEGLGLRPDVLALDLVGQGCAAALPNLRTGEALLAAGRSQRVLSICVEVCSAALYFDDNPGVLISACLFGDGAGAAVLAAAPRRPAPGRMEDQRFKPEPGVPRRPALRTEGRHAAEHPEAASARARGAIRRDGPGPGAGASRSAALAGERLGDAPRRAGCAGWPCARRLGLSQG